MAKYDDAELTSSQGHNKITTICRATINEKDLRLAEKIFYNLRQKKEPITKQEEYRYSVVETHTPGWIIPSQEDN